MVILERGDGFVAVLHAVLKHRLPRHTDSAHSTVHLSRQLRLAAEPNLTLQQSTGAKITKIFYQSTVAY